MKAKIVFAALAAAGAIALGVVAFPPSAWAAPGGALKVLDPDKDGTLDRRELRGRVTAKELASVDTDKDSTLDKNEFSALVEQRFKAADPDNDGTVDAKELKTPAGRALLRLLVK